MMTFSLLAAFATRNRVEETTLVKKQLPSKRKTDR